jgi:hypothetical protein
MGDPMEKVFRCPNVLARCNPLIAALGQFLGESFKQMTTGALRSCSIRDGRLK